MELSEFGLNHGVELDIDATDGDQVVEVKSLPDVRMLPEVTAHDVFKEVIPGEVPELKEDLTLIASDTAALEDLEYLVADLKKVGGMNQAFAQEAQRLYPEFDGKRPLGFYTKQTSATRYKVSLESLYARLKEAVKDLIKKLREMIRRFVLWLVGARDIHSNLLAKSSDELKQEVETTSERAEDRTKELEADMGELRDIAVTFQKELQRGVDIKDQHGETVRISDFDKLVAHYLYDTEAADEVRQFMESRNPVFHDIIEQGPWTKGTEALVDTIQQALSVMQQKAAVLQQVVQQSGAMDVGSELVNSRTLDILSLRLEVAFQGRKMTLQDVSNHYNRLYVEASQSEPHKHLSFEQVFARMQTALASGPTKKLIATGREIGLRLIGVESYLDMLEVRIGNVVTDGSDGMPEHSMAQALREALDSIRQDVRDLSMIANRMNAYRSIVETMSARVVGFAYRLAVAIYRDMQISAHESKAPEVIQLMAKQAAAMRDKHHKGLVSKAFK